MSRVYRYPWSALRGDYIRTGFGLVVTLLPLGAVASSPLAASVMGGLAAVFALFGARTGARHLSRFEVDEDSVTRYRISTLPARRVTVRWREVDRVRLAFYSTRRDRSQGWMHLTIRGGGCKLGFDSIIDGFEDIAALTLSAAVVNGVPLSAATARNFAALGLAVESKDGRPVTRAGRKRTGFEQPMDRG
ncbi:MAG: hypothetical protein O7I42_23810 [Alphaproteobacteria bacterium]|nr:hypothetical protein [Alphaproteobacteria bacterium]